MNLMKQKTVLCLFIAFALAGCGRESWMPLKSGEVVTLEDGHEIDRDALSPDQLRALSAWFEQHRSGWHGSIAPAATEPTQLYLTLEHADGKRTFVRVVVRPNGERYLLLTSSEKWAYRSLWGVVKYATAALPISDQDFISLQNSLRGQPDDLAALSGIQWLLVQRLE